MTENEAIKIINDKYETFFALSTTNDFDMAMATAIKALEEIQQYREIGTVEQLEWCKDASHWKELFKEKLEKYEAIGTIEEFKALKEKSVAKKPKWHPNPCVEDNRIPICPNCNTIMVRTEIFGRTIDEHCVSCGQAIDW